MDTNVKLHVSHYKRYLLNEKSLLIVIGDFSEFITSQKLYEQRYKIASDNKRDVNLEKLMSACALAATSLAERESWGWSVTLPGQSVGYFIGVEPEGMLCSRVKDAEPELSKVYLQRKKGESPVSESHYTPDSDSPVELVNKYFSHALQLDTKIVLDDDASGVLIQTLPGGNLDIIKDMSDSEIIKFSTELVVGHKLKLMDDFLLFYECRCDDEMILEMITSLGTENLSEVFGKQLSVEIECPRCGRAYNIEKKQLLH